MSFLNRVLSIGVSSVVKYTGSGISDYTGNTSPSLTGGRFIDPLSGGGSKSILIPKTGGTATTVTSPLPFSVYQTNMSWAIEHVFFTPRPTSTNLILSTNLGPLITAQSDNLIRINLPISGLVDTDATIYVPTTYEQAIHIVISLSLDSIDVVLNGTTVFSNRIKDYFVVSGTPQYKNITSLVSTNATHVKIFEALNIYPYKLDEVNCQKNYVYCFLGLDEESLIADYGSGISDTTVRQSISHNISPIDQMYVYSYDCPANVSWETWDSDNVKNSGKSVELEIKNVQEFDSSINTYVVENLYELCPSAEGYIHLVLPSYVSASAGARGLLYLERTASDALEFSVDGSGVVRFYLRQAQFDGSGVFTGYASDSNGVNMWTLGTVTNGQLAVGLAWDTLNIYVVFNDTIVQTIPYAFNTYLYTMYIGNNRNLNTANALLGWSSAAYQLRAWDNKPSNLTTSITTLSYGKYTFDSDAAKKYAVPIYVEGSLTNYLPIGYNNKEDLSTPDPVRVFGVQYYIDGSAGLAVTIE